MSAQYHEVLKFWFQELSPKQQFAKDAEVDSQILERFGGLLEQAKAGELFGWRDSPQGRLAEVVVLDQFSRNIYRDQAQAFVADPMALCLAQEAVRAGLDTVLKASERAFLYMPYMHSESKVIQVLSVALYDQAGLEDNYRFACRHREIIERFGRYPHRNVVLGRTSTPSELEFLRQPGSSF